MIKIPGYCPACDTKVEFESAYDWLRDHLKCPNCASIPRERAMAWCLETFVPDWRERVIHECSPVSRGISGVMKRECKHYIGSQYYPQIPWGNMHNGFRSENLEALTFADETIDIHCHLDVLEHVNNPDACFREMVRTLRPGGRMIFTTPVYEGLVSTTRRAAFDGDEVHHFFEPEYHGNPVGDGKSLVTFHYGSDFSDLILEWVPGCAVNMVTLNDAGIGVLGKFREVFVVTKPSGDASAQLRQKVTL